VLVVGVVSVLGVGSGVEDEGVVDAFFRGAGAGSEGCGEFGFGVTLVAGEVDADVPAVDGALVAQPQDGCGLAVAGQDGVDVAELAPEPHDGRAEAGPAAADVCGDPGGEGLAGGLVDGGGHADHDGLPDGWAGGRGG
jgi:hypothetical protein